MRLARRSSAALSWLVCVALLLTLLAPSITRARQGGSVDAWASVCSANAVAGESITPSPGRSDLGHVHDNGVCGFCMLHVAMGGVPPSELALPAAFAVSTHGPVAVASAPVAIVAWRDSQPRAPPAIA
jgi:hypothetical protein